MSDNHAETEPVKVSITKPESTERIDAQCVRVKKEISVLRAMIDQHPHDEQRTDATKLFDAAHDAFQALQTFISSR